MKMFVGGFLAAMFIAGVSHNTPDQLWSNIASWVRVIF